MSIFKKKQTAPKEETLPPAEPVPVLIDAEPEIEEEPKSLLESVEGKYASIPINLITFGKAAVKTDEIIVLKKDGRYEVAGLGNIEVKVIDASEDELRILMFDHLLKHTELPEDRKLGIYKFELSHNDIVEKLSGKTPAELNGYTEEHFAGMVLKDEIDPNLRILPVDAIIEAAKLPKDVQKVLGGIVAKTGTGKITAEAVKALQGVGANETEILMRLWAF